MSSSVNLLAMHDMMKELLKDYDYENNMESI